ncbi:MAG: class I SAM-dependent DNA methyltransferase [Planctomycetota bacterium]
MCLATEQYDYRLSHVDPAKGRSYDANFVNSPWRAFVWRRERRVLDRILQKYYADRKIAHLDFACGTGRILEFLYDRTDVSVGIDVSESMLDVARRKTPHAEFFHADITRRDVLGDRSFNLITAFRFFPNAQAELRSEAIGGLVDHLAPDGLLIFNNHKNESSLLHRLGRIMGKYPTAMSLDDVKELVFQVGLRIVETFAIGVLPATEKYMFAPELIHHFSDFSANALGLGKVLSQNVIYVCGRKSGS